MSDDWHGYARDLQRMANADYERHREQISGYRAEISRLRAEVERLTGALEDALADSARLTRTLSDERRHADALAELVADQIETENAFWTLWDEQAVQAIQRHRARRQG